MTDLEKLESFRNRFFAFEKTYHSLNRQKGITEADEKLFVETRRTLLERLRELEASDLKTEIPSSLLAEMNALKGFDRLSSLSDTQLKDLKQVMDNAAGQMHDFYEGLKRRELYRSGLLRQERKKRFYQFVLFPALFGVLVFIFARLGLKFFLNR